MSRFSFLGAAPSVVARVWPDRLEVADAGGNARRRRSAARCRCASCSDSVRSVEAAVPFTGGWVGFFGYDTIRLVERLPNRPRDPYGLPYAAFARFDSLVAFDHARQRVVAIANEIEGEVDRAAAERRLAELEAILTESVASGGIALPIERPAPAATLPPTLSADEYQAAVRKAKAYIRGRRHLPGGAGAPLAGAALARRARGLPRAAHGEPEPVHGAARDAGRDAGVELARDGGAQVGRPARDPAHRRHPPARRRRRPRTTGWPRSSSPTPRSAPST